MEFLIHSLVIIGHSTMTISNIPQSNIGNFYNLKFFSFQFFIHYSNLFQYKGDNTQWPFYLFYSNYLPHLTEDRISVFQTMISHSDEVLINFHFILRRTHPARLYLLASWFATFSHFRLLHIVVYNVIIFGDSKSKTHLGFASAIC